MKKPKTPADRLLAMFDSDPHADYIALYAAYDTTRLTIKKKCKHRQNHSIESVPDPELSSAAKVSHHESEVDPAELKEAATTATLEAEKLRNSIRDSLSVTSNEQKGKLLLALVWTDKDSRTRFDMFPELVAADCTYGMNKEERPVMLLSSIDGNNKTFTHTWGFLPSEAKWVFNWVLGSALPTLHNWETLDRVRFFLTDQDGQLMHATKHNIGPRTTMPNAVDRICAWHKLTQNLTNHSKYRGQIKSNENNNDSAQAEWNALVTWLWSLCRSPEREEEAGLLLTLLDLYLNEDEANDVGSLSHELKSMLRDFIAKPFMDSEAKLMAHHFFSVLGFGKITTSIVEAENSAAKNHGYAPGPQDNIDGAYGKMSKRTGQRNRERRRNAVDNLERVPAAQADRDQTVTELTGFSSDWLWNEFDLSHLYQCMNVDETTCLVKFEDDKEPEKKYSGDREGYPYGKRQNLRKDWVVPKLERTRTVTLVKDSDTGLNLAMCSCGSWGRQGMACRHIYAALSVEPIQWDAQYRYWKEFQLLCLGDDLPMEIKQKLAAASDQFRKVQGTPVEAESFPVHSPTLPAEWFKNH